MKPHPLSQNMKDVLKTVSENTNPDGRISGRSVAAWLNKSKHPEGVREALRALTNRGLIAMTPMDDPADEFRKQFPDRLKAVYSVVKRQE